MKKESEIDFRLDDYFIVLLSFIGPLFAVGAMTAASYKYQGNSEKSVIAGSTTISACFTTGCLTGGDILSYEHQIS